MFTGRFFVHCSPQFHLALTCNGYIVNIELSEMGSGKESGSIAAKFVEAADAGIGGVVCVAQRVHQRGWHEPAAAHGRCGGGVGHDSASEW